MFLWVPGAKIHILLFLNFIPCWMQQVFLQDRVTLIGVDREKKTLSHLSEALNVTNVPTIIVLKNGKEMGRVVEYGKLWIV